MLLPIKLICPASKQRRDGTSLIFIQYCERGKYKTLLNTGIGIPSQYWHKKLQRVNENLPSEFGETKRLNLELQRQIRIAEDIIQLAINENISSKVNFVKKYFSPECTLDSLNPIKNQSTEVLSSAKPDFFQQIEDYMLTKSKSVAPKMMNVYKNTRDTLRCFESFRNKKITFNKIDFNFYEELKDYLLCEHILRRKKEIIKGFKPSTAGKIIKQLRIFIRNRVRKNIIPPINLEEFKIIDEQSDAIYLTNSEIKKLYTLDLSQKQFLEKYRDLFVLGCLTGLRFSDFSKIQSEDIRNKTLYRKQQKSNHWVVIPLRNEADNILNQKFKKNIPVINDVDFNRHIKIIGELAGINELITFSHKRANKRIEITKPKYEWITSHTCRRSFCTNEFLAGTPVELIMKISGHKSLKDFYRYIKISPEEAAEKIKEIWLNRGEYKAAI